MLIRLTIVIIIMLTKYLFALLSTFLFLSPNWLYSRSISLICWLVIILLFIIFFSMRIVMRMMVMMRGWDFIGDYFRVYWTTIPVHFLDKPIEFYWAYILFIFNIIIIRVISYHSSIYCTQIHKLFSLYSYNLLNH